MSPEDQNAVLEKMMVQVRTDWAGAVIEIGDEVVEEFSRDHPDIRLTYHQWLDLKEILGKAIMRRVG